MMGFRPPTLSVIEEIGISIESYIYYAYKSITWYDQYLYFHALNNVMKSM